MATSLWLLLQQLALYECMGGASLLLLSLLSGGTMLWEVKWLPKAPETQPDVVVRLVPACWLSVVACVCCVRGSWGCTCVSQCTMGLERLCPLHLPC